MGGRRRRLGCDDAVRPRTFPGQGARSRVSLELRSFARSMARCALIDLNATPAADPLTRAVDERSHDGVPRSAVALIDPLRESNTASIAEAALAYAAADSTSVGRAPMSRSR